MYKITFTSSASKIFRKLDSQIKNKVIAYFDQDKLLKNPKSFGKALLYEQRGNWRYRVGDYRIICKIIEKELVILILDLGHKKEVYK